MVPSASADNISTRVCEDIFVEDDDAFNASWVVHVDEISVIGLAYF